VKPWSQNLGVAVNADYSLSCQRLAERLQLPLLGPGDCLTDFSYLLTYTSQGLSLQQTGAKAAGPVRVDFTDGTAAYRRAKGGGELIVKAVAGDKQIRPSVLDATAGLGRDAFVLASWGYPVTLCERSPVVACLLEDGLQRAAQIADSDLQAVLGRMQLQSVDAVDYLAQLRPENFPDVIVIDPMFPPTKKQALVKKEMQAFHQLVGPDQDGEQLLQAALTAAIYRVVVKRPRKAQHLASRKPNFSVEGKAIRFDVYTKKTFSR
jgi:16S rRNA (guanine1516-N2)-methyltransferase